MRGSHKTFVVVLVMSLVAPVAAVTFLFTIDMKPSLLSIENEVLGFSYRLPPFLERKTVTVNDLKNPVNSQEKDYPPVALAELAPAQGSPVESAVSLVVLGKTTRLAVIKGVVLKEGDPFQGATVSRIERDRVLLTNGKEEKWLMAK